MARLARDSGLNPILAGRNGRELARVATDLGCEYAVLSLDDASAFESLLARTKVLLNAAGRFRRRFRPWYPRLACWRALSRPQRRGGRPGLRHQKPRAGPSSRGHADAGGRLRRGPLGLPSRCTSRAAFAILSGFPWLFSAWATVTRLGQNHARRARRPVRVRRQGSLQGVAAGDGERQFHIDGADVPGLPVSWGDVVTSYYSTGVPDITVYFEATPALRVALAANRLASLCRKRATAPSCSARSLP